ncbi:MAG TPA: protoporphyrinogen oxidase HemJ [Gammaproteobacteria bacterium]|nr:protoporphyrinogen oxidase HemJ [Gammaproteobacteria bacterium]
MRIILSLHIIFMVTWFAGLFYLPRLFVYHAATEEPLLIEQFKLMERRLFYAITTPGAVLTLIFGFWMLFAYAWDAYRDALWIHIKLGLVVILVLYHAYCGWLVTLFAQDKNPHSPRFYRFFNEFPTLILISVVLLVILKPF